MINLGKKHITMNRILEQKIVVIIRTSYIEKIFSIIDSVLEGGLNIIELSMSTKKSLSLLEKIKTKYENKIIFGAGTVLDSETARIAILNGIEFIVTPNTDKKTIELCNKYSIVKAIGALTPTEVINAWEMGADFIKIFPANVFGPDYIKTLKGPYPDLSFIPTGYVDIKNAKSYMQAGAAAVAVGGGIFTEEMVASNDFKAIVKNSKQLVEIMNSL